jgi:hypothetical protein
MPGAMVRSSSASSSSSSGSSLSPGAIAGIAIGTAVGGALLAVAIVAVVVRVRKSRYDNFKESMSTPGGGECHAWTRSAEADSGLGVIGS